MVDYRQLFNPSFDNKIDKEINVETLRIKKIGWGLGVCNMNCKHCYNRSGDENSVPRYTLGQLIDVADKICPHISGRRTPQCVPQTSSGMGMGNTSAGNSE
jgi:hypothetical protein